MKREELTLHSDFDGLPLSLLLILPEGKPKGILQISHGMEEHKERYEPFMTFLAEQGYGSVIHDHRGHGKSVRDPEDLGYFYTEDIRAITDDLRKVSDHILSRFPDTPLFLLGHSMGSLVARVLMKDRDESFRKLILCGPPTKNNGVYLALLLTRLSIFLRGSRFRNPLMNRLALGAANRKFRTESAWISSDPDTVEKFRKDPLCGFLFTNNGFYNLFVLTKEACSKRGFQVRNPQLPILLIAGREDPIIRSPKHFYRLEAFLRDLGYRNVRSILYPGMRHELLNEKDRRRVWQDLLDFLEE